MDQNYVPVTENQAKITKPTKSFSIFRTCVGLIVGIVIIVVALGLYFSYSSGSFLPWIVKMRHTSKDIKLYDNSNDITKAQELFQKNNIQIDETREIITNYEVPGLNTQPGQQNVQISLKYLNLPIYSRHSTILFDKENNFMQEQDAQDVRNSVMTSSRADGYIYPEPYRNAGTAFLRDELYADPTALSYSCKNCVETFFTSIKNNLPSVVPTISYQQALAKALENASFASKKTKGYSAQLGIIENGSNPSGKAVLVWKIITNDKQIETGLFITGLTKYHALIDANTGGFICANRAKENNSDYNCN